MCVTINKEIVTQMVCRIQSLQRREMGFCKQLMFDFSLISKTLVFSKTSYMYYHV